LKKVTITYKDADAARAALDAHNYRHILQDLDDFLISAIGGNMFTATQVAATCKQECLGRTKEALLQKGQQMVVAATRSKLKHLLDEADVKL